MTWRAGVARLPRELHPLAWWAWAVGLAAAASLTSNPYLQLLVVAVVCLVVLLRRSAHPWSRVFGLYLALGVVIVLTRVFFRVLVGGAYGTEVLLMLPEIPLPEWVRGIQILGPVTQEAVLGGLYDGLRLATIVICVGAANALANPKRLLASMPAALYEVGTALVVAVNVMPQLAAAVRRVRAAQRLRPAPRGRRRRLTSVRRVLVPVLEDALERSLSLAAGMDTRGYGRSGGQTRRQRWTAGGLQLAGLAGIAVGVYGVLDLTAPRWLALPMLAVGTALAFAGIAASGRRVGRTRYRPAPWRWPETVVTLAGVAVAVGVWLVGRSEPLVAQPSLLAPPLLTLGALAAPLVGLAALLAPPPPQTDARPDDRSDAAPHGRVELEEVDA
ncbi:CbiQ family ECF transporter T component [Nocardioides zeae]|uniref:CbiQ family ECF transporter T component n=1 Tax=Nocardioides imazamoxiresistens TaxID=3231893 RepID=A0ABU3PRE6_9ACTN|nr:CbiQ family ECF transporter T component [Nocardioides zeae]MDT9591804.1 CbiQ family ECF transporter T component [Nocardioides zeae]